MRKLIVLVIAALVPATAQQPAEQRQDSMKGVQPKNLAPVSTEVLRVKLPRPADRKLKNGLSVLIMENHRVPTVTLDLVLPASTLSDPEGLPGVAQFTANLLNQGTTTRTSRQIAETSAEIGARINANAQYGAQSTHLTASALSENLDPLLDLFADILLNPAFPQKEFDTEKNRISALLQQMRANPQFVGDERLRHVLYAGDNRQFGGPTPDSLRKMTREDLVAFYKAYYRPGNSILGISGDVKPDDIVARLERRLAAWAPGAAAAPKFALGAPIPDKKIYVVNRPNSVQTYLVLANRAIDRTNPDYIVCQVLNRVLGSGPASRLFINIREEHGFTYGVYSSFTALKYMNHFSASSSVRTDVTAPALDEFLKEFRTIRDVPVPPAELENAKRAIVAGFALSLESQAGMLQQRLQLREYGLPEDYWDTYPQRVMAITAADVQRVARKYIPADNLQLIAVGDASKIADVLAKYGPVERYDQEGRKEASK
jgi:predicted Zn-dependent peptidase